MRDKHGLLTAPIAQVLFKMSLPNIVGIFTVLSYNLIDTFFISKLGTDALAAISFTFPVTLIMSSIAIGIGSGVSTNLGRLIGSGDTSQAKVFLHDALVLCFSIILVLAMIGFFTIEPLFKVLGATATNIELIKQYLHIWYFGAPILVVMMVANQGIRATGDTRSPALIMILSSVINVILDPVLIFGLGPFTELGIQGAAIATLIAWGIAFGFSNYILIVSKKLLGLTEFCLNRMRHNWARLAHIARPAALMNLINPLANTVLMAMLARFDHAAVAAFGAGIRIESLALIVVMALSSSLLPFISQNLGAGQPERARQAVKLAIKFIFIFQTVLYIPLFFSAKPIAEIFSSDPQVIKWLSFYVMVLPLAYGPLGIVILFANVLNAYHRPVSSLVINVSRLFLLMLPMAYLGAVVYGVHGLLLALPVTNILMGVACFVLSKRISSTSI
ncbi:MATE family efflux transporter [Shewanella sp. 202IG2-18]|uniref:MATE family efflux transporter n=1 Tax=Parashewanella hymeniacidonis TaxID=2807618 RepID=UPI001961CF18|nr:MATE family efflux transporter [Parashewanella hymeniacidonis]MBM7072469.1 MATE family efflux transporter [Parashewanella hymeniacidonis]